MSSVPARNYIFIVSNYSTRTRCEYYSIVRMKTLKQSQCCCCGIFIVNCEHILNFVLIVVFEQAKVCWLYTEKRNTFVDKIRYVMLYVVVF